MLRLPSAAAARPVAAFPKTRMETGPKMSHVPHELAEEFPDKVERIRELRASDAHFARLTDEYHELNRTIHRGETDIEPMGDFHLEDLKKRRLALLDDIKTRLG